jgi:hypothetical protein
MIRQTFSGTWTSAAAAGLALALSLGACGGSSGFQQAALRERVSPAAPQVNEREVDAAFALKPQLPKPYRLGVYFREVPADAENRHWRWAPEHKQAILGMAGALRTGGEIADVFAIGGRTVAGDDLRAIRIAAARHGADAVLVVSGGDQAESANNAWAFSYVALLPMLFAPGTELEVRFLAHAEMWDVRNEYLYLAAEAESEVRQQRAPCWIDRQQATRSAQEQATDLLAAELRQRLGRLHGGS